MKTKKKVTVYFTNHRKILNYIERFAREHEITVSSAILGFVGIGLMVENLPEGIEQLREAMWKWREI